MATTGELGGKCPECDNTTLGMRTDSDCVSVTCHECGWVKPVEESTNAGCDRCGIHDRAPGSKYCYPCGEIEDECYDDNNNTPIAPVENTIRDVIRMNGYVPPNVSGLDLTVGMHSGRGELPEITFHVCERNTPNSRRGWEGSVGLCQAAADGSEQVVRVFCEGCGKDLATIRLRRAVPGAKDRDNFCNHCGVALLEPGLSECDDCRD